MQATPIQLAFLILGTALLVRELLRLRKARASLSWRQTDGVIVDVRIEEGSAIRVGSDADRDEGRFRPKVRFSYVVHGRRFESSNLSFRPLDVWGYSDAIDRVAGIRRHATVPVFYNPEKPEEAVLMPGPTGTTYGVLATYGAFLAAVAFGIWKNS